jgi:hypothetical protein
MATTPAKSLPLQPTNAPVLPLALAQYSQQQQQLLNNSLRVYFTQIDNLTQIITGDVSGSTKDRPGTNLYIGYPYFDTTLGIPIWWNGTKWVNASGTGV